MTPYEQTAHDWLTRYGVIFGATRRANKMPPWNRTPGQSKRQHWGVGLETSTGHRLTFDFFQSISATAKGEPVTAYDVLSCLASDVSLADMSPDDIAAEFGPMKPSEAYRCHAWGKRLAAFLAHLPDGAVAALREIQ